MIAFRRVPLFPLSVYSYGRCPSDLPHLCRERLRLQVLGLVVAFPQEICLRRLFAAGAKQMFDEESLADVLVISFAPGIIRLVHLQPLRTVRRARSPLSERHFYRSEEHTSELQSRE